MHAFIPSLLRECTYEDEMLDLGMVSELGLEDWKGGRQNRYLSEAGFSGF